MATESFPFLWVKVRIGVRGRGDSLPKVSHPGGYADIFVLQLDT